MKRIGTKKSAGANAEYAESAEYAEKRILCHALEVVIESCVEVLRTSSSDALRMTSCLWLKARLKLDLNPHP